MKAVPQTEMISANLLAMDRELPRRSLGIRRLFLTAVLT
jgi:hypothetical protein